MAHKGEFYFQWHFMNYCNLRCKHCYQESYTREELEPEKLLFIAQQISDVLKKWNMLGRISLTGGEPFLSKNLPMLIDYLEHDEYITHFNILTNGTCITPEHFDIITHCRKLKQIQISLDGSDSPSHDAVRGPGAFSKALESIRILRQNNIETAVMFTLIKSNKDSALEMIDFAEANGVNALTIERVTPCGHSTITDTLSSQELKQVYEAVTLRANTLNSGLVIRRQRPLWINTACLNTRENARIGGFCPVGLTSLAILWDGTVLPCRRLNIPIGNIFREGLFRIWYGSEVLWRIRDKSNLQGRCRGCVNVDRCGGCRAAAYEMTGDYMGEDSQCWM
ncbi:MAG: radical SAM protein [Synergistaceae bacterium]|nr:radical SAM protein [Synergistaceae bacterium]